jgi:hypothetical protein
MKLIITTILVLLSTSSNLLQITPGGSFSKWVISKNSSLIVNGVTNVNKFSCLILPSAKTDTIMVTKGQLGALLLSGSINIKINEFDCSNSIMTRQLKKTLKANEFPYLHIRFLSLKIFDKDLQTRAVKGQVEIELAGKSKSFPIEYQLSISKNKMILRGNQSINFSDFNLHPPTKMGKLIKVKDKLDVALYLNMELLDE